MNKPRYTRRKFYGKWLYKVTVSVPGAPIFRIKSVSDVMMFCVSDESQENHGYSTKDKAYQNRKEILAIAELFNSWEDKTWSKRIESNTMDIYTNDNDKYQQAVQKLSNLIVNRFEPDPNYTKELNVSTNVIVKKYPHNRYKHKVYLLPHKIDRDPAFRQQYLDWVESQSPRILITEAVKTWFIKTHWNWDRRYVLVEDQQTLLMLKLRNSDVAGKVYDYVLADK